eukprot:superscaffoldBa00000261_g3298
MRDTSSVYPIPEELSRRYRGCRAVTKLKAKLKAKLMAKQWRYKPSILLLSVVTGNVKLLANKTDKLAALLGFFVLSWMSSKPCMSHPQVPTIFTKFVPTPALMKAAHCQRRPVNSVMFCDGTALPTSTKLLLYNSSNTHVHILHCFELLW